MPKKTSKSASAAAAEIRHMVRMEGLPAAFKALVAVCEDPKAPAQARATASTTLFRAGGLLDKAPDDEGKEVHEMTWNELVATVREGAAISERFAESSEGAKKRRARVAPRKDLGKSGILG